MHKRLQQLRTDLGKLSRGFWPLTGGQAVIVLGNHFLTIAISAYAYAMTKSAWGYALQQLLMFLPWMLFSGISGPLVDRRDRRRVLIVANLARCLLVLCYPLCRTLGPVLVLNFLNSTANVFAMTARTAIAPALCPGDRLYAENGLRTAMYGFVDLVGPAFAGAILARIGTTTAFRVTSIAAALGLLLFSLIPASAGRPPEAESPNEPVLPRMGRDLKEAFAFLRTDRVLIAAIGMFCLYTCGQNGTNTIFYPYLESVLKAGPAVFGLSISFYFGANLLAGLILAKYGKRLENLPMFLLMLPPACVWFCYSQIRTVPPVIFCGIIEGISFAILNLLLVTQVQSRAPLSMTGRVWGLTYSITSTFEVAGILITGAVAGRFGVQAAYRSLGIAGVLVILLAEMVRRRRIGTAVARASYETAE
jgi:MFS family permease